MGLAVATALTRNGSWKVNLLDLNSVAGEKAQKSLGSNATFRKTNVTDYDSLSSAFEAAFQTDKRIDFIFANAGICERDSFYAVFDKPGPPPKPNQLSVDINLKGVVDCGYLAQHYFRKSPSKGKGCTLVSTASVGGLYPSPFCPMYSAAKHGVIGFTRSIAEHFFVVDGIAAHCICPGTVRTNLLDEREWSGFPAEYFTPVESIVDAVLMLIEGGEMQDSKGNKVSASEAWGMAVEVNGKNFYFRKQPDFCDENMAKMWESTSVEQQSKTLLS